MAEINESSLEHLLSLSRMEEKDQNRRTKILKDLSKILDYFNELKEVDTENIEPMSGGTFLSDVLRVDEEKYRDVSSKKEQRDMAVDQFPRNENGYLKVPGVFE